MPRDLSCSRSPHSYWSRHSPSSPPLGHKYSRRSRRDRSRSPYSSFSHSRQKIPSVSPRRHKSRSPTVRRRKSRSPTTKRYRRQRSISSTLSPTHSSSPIRGSVERKNAIEKLRKEVEGERKRIFWRKRLLRQEEAEQKLVEDETVKRVEQAIQKKVDESLNSPEIRLELQKWLEEGRKRLQMEVAAQLEKEKETSLIQARQKEVQARKEKEVLERILEENKRRVEEAQRREALEQQRIEEDRYRELEELQRQKEEALRRKKQEDEEQRLNQMKVLGKNKLRPKLSFAFGSK